MNKAAIKNAIRLEPTDGDKLICGSRFVFVPFSENERGVLRCVIHGVIFLARVISGGFVPQAPFCTDRLLKGGEVA